jgi:D-alanine-D-alanine ligase
MKKLRVLALMLEDFVPPSSVEGMSDEEIAPFKTEFDVATILRELGHETRVLGVADDLGLVRQSIQGFKPDIVFNLLEEFRGIGAYVPYLLGYLELLGQAYTGCNARGLLLATNKDLSKKILRHHRIPVPDFAVFPRKRVVRRPKYLAFPLIVKSSTEHGSVGISHASIVHDDEKLKDRAAYIHEELGTDALAEEYIEGRELYVGILGNNRLDTLPIWEMHFHDLPEGSPRIATEKVKWDHRYQQKINVATAAAQDLPEGAEARILRICKRAYRALGQTGYARLDLRLAQDGKVLLLESNPNPQLAFGEDFAEAARHVGIEYAALIQRILNLGLRYHRLPRI